MEIFEKKSMDQLTLIGAVHFLAIMSLKRYSLKDKTTTNFKSRLLFERKIVMFDHIIDESMRVNEYFKTCF